MSHRRLVATAVFVAAGIALIPNVAQANDGSPATLPSTTVGGSALTKAVAANTSTFTSPASSSVRVQHAAAGTTAAVRAMAGAAGNTIYATPTPFCGTETGTGTQADPYCLVQDAVDAAQPGDTVDIQGTMGTPAEESVTVRTSGISIVGLGTQAFIRAAVSGAKPALILDGVSDVTVSNMMLTAGAGPAAVQVVNSSGITFDSGYFAIGSGGDRPALTIDGTSHDVTVRRTYLDTAGSAGGSGAVSVAPGAEDITLTGNVIAASGITAAGVRGLDVTNNTIQRGCYPAVAVTGASTGVSIENNLFEDANPSTDALLGGYRSQCVEQGHGWAADVTVDAESSSGVTTDYNAFYVYGADATAPYTWAGTTYPTLAAFRAAVPQGAHDLNDTVQAGTAFLRPNETANVDLLPAPRSAVIGSADPNAPGKLGTDFFGVSPFSSRGAVEYDNPNPQFAVALSGKDTSAYAGTLTANIISAPLPLAITFAWGDGTTSTSTANGSAAVTIAHRYAKAGIYTMTVTVSDSVGNVLVNTMKWATEGTSYKAYGPTRLLDTRYGIGAAKAKIPARGTIRLQVGGRGTIPAAGLAAAVLNLTVTNPAASGFIIAYPDGAARPNTSNVNFTAKRTVPNLSIVPVGGSGYVDLYNSSTGSVDLIADIDGYFGLTSASYYQPLSPYRLADTRYGTGTPKHQLTPGGSIALQVAGADKGLLPSSGITAVALNVTATNTKSSGVVTAYPDGTATPVASNVNFTSGQIIANSVVTPVGSDGKIRVSLNPGAKSMDVVVDVVGYYSASAKGAYVPTLPTRLMDTRSKTDADYGPIPGGAYVPFLPIYPVRTDITGIVLNTTVTNTRGTGWLGVAPDPNSLAVYQNPNGHPVRPATPISSTLNWVRGGVVPNLVQASLGKNGILDLFNRSSGNTDLVVDAFGFYQVD